MLLKIRVQSTDGSQHLRKGEIGSLYKSLDMIKLNQIDALLPGYVGQQSVHLGVLHLRPSKG